MRSLWMSKTYLWNTASLLLRHYFNKGDFDLSKEVLWVSVGQRTTKLKSWRSEKNPATQPKSNQMRAARVGVIDDQIIFKLWQTTTLQPFELLSKYSFEKRALSRFLLASFHLPKLFLAVKLLIKKYILKICNIERERLTSTYN